MIYLYAVCESLPGTLRTLGVEDAPLQIEEVAGLGAVFSVHADLDVTPTHTSLWAHEAVVDELLRAGTLLPLRFGTTLPDVQVLRDILRRDHKRFHALLERVRGRVELAVRVGVPVETADGRDGRSYLRARLATQRAGEEAAQLLLVPLAALASATERSRPGADPVVKASYLVPRDEVERFTVEVLELQERHPELSVSCTGPWAPYSFVRESLS
jgi:hypothetical protein